MGNLACQVCQVLCLHVQISGEFHLLNERRTFHSRLSRSATSLSILVFPLNWSISCKGDRVPCHLRAAVAGKVRQCVLQEVLIIAVWKVGSRMGSPGLPPVKSTYKQNFSCSEHRVGFHDVNKVSIVFLGFIVNMFPRCSL